MQAQLKDFISPFKKENLSDIYSDSQLFEGHFLLLEEIRLAEKSQITEGKKKKKELY